MAAIKTILVTVFTKDGTTKTVYGNYNAVTEKRNGWVVSSSKLYKCKMSDETYWNNSTHVEVT